MSKTETELACSTTPDTEFFLASCSPFVASSEGCNCMGRHELVKYSGCSCQCCARFWAEEFNQ